MNSGELEVPLVGRFEYNCTGEANVNCGIGEVRSGPSCERKV